MTKGLTPYQILGKLTIQTKNERYEVCWKKGPMMKGQQFYQTRLTTAPADKNQCSSELYKVTQARIWISRRFLTKKIDKRMRTVSVSSRCEDSTKSGGLVPEGVLEQAKAENQCTSPRVAIGTKPLPEVQAIPPLEEPP